MKALIVACSIAVAACVGLVGGAPAQAAPAGDDQVIAFVVRGVGLGHGRGLSQWGAYGRALDGQSWQQIVDAYYQGTSSGTAGDASYRVRLTGWDGSGTVGVVSRTSTARWSGGNASSATNYSSVYAVETSPNVFTIHGATSGHGCPGSAAITVPTVDLDTNSPISDHVRRLQEFLNYFGFNAGPVDGDFGSQTEAAVKSFQTNRGLTDDGLWRSEEVSAAQAMVAAESPPVTFAQLQTGVTGPIRFTTTVDQSGSAPGDVLGLCELSGELNHYRGVIEVADTSAGNRVVNELNLENYLRGVVPKEVAASWGNAGGGKGMQALSAQAVAARSFALSESRYGYADTCDTSSCQVYGGSATRSSPNGGISSVEHTNTDTAIKAAAAVVRKWPGGGIVSTQFSASNGPRTAGGYFPAVNDPWDDQPGNPNHRWTRIIDADAVIAKYGLSSANAVATVNDTITAPSLDGIYDNIVTLGGGKHATNWNFRNDFKLPSPGFELIPVRRDVTAAGTFAFIGNSVGVSVTSPCCGEDFHELTEGIFQTAMIDVYGGRATQSGNGNDGVAVASKVPVGTDLVVVELGYNDSPSAMSDRIDAVMTALRSRNVGEVLWVNVSERRPEYAATNAALAAAVGRWSELSVLDWQAASAHGVANRWFVDDVHLTATGRAEFSLWLRDHIVTRLSDGYVPPRPLQPGEVLRVPVVGVGDVPGSGVTGVSLNVTAVRPVADGWLRVWPCGAPEPPTAAVNYVRGGVSPNAVVLPVDSTGEVCVVSLVATDVVVDLNGWFDAGLRNTAGKRLLDSREVGGRVEVGEVLRVPVVGVGDVPGSGVTGVSLNVTAVRPVADGWLRVWPCGAPEPPTAAVNYVRGGVSPNAVVLPVDSTGEVCVVSLVATDVVVDLNGWFDAGLRNTAGKRLLDSREVGGRVEVGEVLRVPVVGVGDVPGSGVTGVSLNVTAVRPVADGWLRVWPCGAPEPPTAAVNYVRGGVSPNAVVLPVDSTGEVCVVSLVATDVVVDLNGWFDAGLRNTAGKRLVDTRFR